MAAVGEDTPLVDFASQDLADDIAINQLFDPINPPNIDLNAEIDQSGKADDAEDFEDISDDDLPEEEEATNGNSADVPALTDDGGTSNDTDDLFGDGRESSPFGGEPALSPRAEIADDEEAPDGPDENNPDYLRSINFDPPPASTLSTNQDRSIPEAPENLAELARMKFPDFKQGIVLNFNELFPQGPANWIEKKPPKNPKPLIPTKLSLDLDIDQEKQFRIPGPASLTTLQKIQAAEAHGLVSCLEPEPVDQDDLEIFRVEGDSEEYELIGGFTLQDIDTVCEDWDEIIDPPTPSHKRQESPVRDADDEDAAWEREIGFVPAPKRRKITHQKGLPAISRFSAPNFDSFEEATAKSAKRVRLDLNDPYLLIDDMASERLAKRPRLNHKMKRMADGNMSRDISQRFNISNDEAYEALKENVRDKVRATLGGVQVEHSASAAKLLWPYYHVKLPDANPFSYHRPLLQVRAQINKSLIWAKPRSFKRKEFKGLRIPDIYKESRDLCLNDNSTAALFEYSEEVPTVLSNFGMGNRVINYYRMNQPTEDKLPHKMDIGEAKILLWEDRSPFSIFGDVGKGEIVPTLQNQMYRAPIFKHPPRKTDFLLGRTSNQAKGLQYYLRKIDHLFVVGQNFPSTDVPGPHSRKVTNTSKNRLKMLAYRLIRQYGSVSLGDVTQHIKDSNDAQNRQKLKEFLKYDKDTKSWSLKENEKLMDPEAIDSMVQPEDVCLMDAMQVGAYEVEKSGFAIDEKDLDKDDDDRAVEPQNENLANQLAPWRTTKAFIDATTGKAMLKLRGEGDPTGHGLGFSFIKTSMKGGFLNVIHEQGPQATSADALERERKANNGHAYSVKKQNEEYHNVINEIWNKQKESLQNGETYDDADVQPQEDEDERLYAQSNVAATPRFDEGVSQISRSAVSARAGKRKLRIVRRVKDENGTEVDVEEILEDPGIISQYIKSSRERAEADLEQVFIPTLCC